MSHDHRHVLRDEFDRAAEAFTARSAGRFDAMGVPEFSRVQPHESVLEVGAGTGNFLSLFSEHAAILIALDLTEKMLRVARRNHPRLAVVMADGACLPVASRSVDLVASAQALHHVFEPVPFVKEMRRVCKDTGRVLIVDQAATESYEQIAFMNEVETIRDPSHAASRPPSAFRAIVMAAGLEILDERLFQDESRFSNWMWPDEFPAERIERTRAFVEKFGSETGMEFERDGDDWIFTRRRMMLLARPAGRRAA